MSKTDWAGLKNLQKKTEKLHGEHDIPFKELFNASFMNRYTAHSTINNFFEADGLVFTTSKEFENLQEEKLDQHVQNSTNFESWDEMITKAGEHWLANELGF